MKATVTLDATPALLGALDRLGESMRGGQTAAKPRARAAKSAEAEPQAAPAEKAPEKAPEAAPSKPAEDRDTKPAQAAKAAQTQAPAPAKAEPAPAQTPAGPAPARMTAEEGRQMLIAVVQKYGNPEALQAKIAELGYQSVPSMPDDVRGDFFKWVHETFPVDDKEVANG